MTVTSRLEGLETHVAVKAPCRSATTANITLSGLQTIDGVALAAQDRVLVKNQTATTENGIWIVQSSEWVRALDFDGSRDAVGGTIVRVNAGSINAGSIWSVAGNGTKAIGAEAITFEPSSGNADLQAALATSTGDTLIRSKPALTASARTLHSIITERADITPQDFADLTVIDTGVNDASAALNLAVDAAFDEGRDVFVPAGRYRLDSAITIKSDDWLTTTGLTAFAPGIALKGAGPATVFESRVSSGAAFDIDSIVDHTVSYRSLLNLKMSDFVIANGDGNALDGINLRTSLGVQVHNVVCANLNGDGFNIQCDVGDLDGSVYVELFQCLAHYCKGWGIDAKAAVAKNEISYLKLDQCWLQGNGTAEAYVASTGSGVLTHPSSGGARLKGQSYILRQCGFTFNENVQLLVPGESGAATTMKLDTVTFENSIKRGLLVTGVNIFSADNTQIHQTSPSFEVFDVMEFYPNAALIEAEMTRIFVRTASHNDAMTVLKNTRSFSAQPSQVKASGWSFHEFGYTGQTVQIAVTGPAIPNECYLTFTASTATLLPSAKGARAPLRYRTSYSTGASFENGPFFSYTVPPAGITRTGITGLSDGTYNVYLFDNANIPSLEVSSAAPTADSDTGYLVKTGETGKVWVGRLAVSGGSVVTGASANWCNPTYNRGGWEWWSAAGKKMGKAALTDAFAGMPTSDADGIVIGTQV